MFCLNNLFDLKLMKKISFIVSSKIKKYISKLKRFHFRN